ncbi:hypothetical protein LO771_01405 [Streptacidiphilus sp. ASG 303]|uniref:hypothetical protein n=1 Tax=Streptacidiphilus sp. ASG 303 TaxID=2896847 RepID=UPI001E3259D8|nr:hypothetical protein [Streptacidiphilus sp. ASG 303]MCD0481100.1 hypothetical protein [Streptacidiphilus sp. ASG 303]
MQHTRHGQKRPRTLLNLGVYATAGLAAIAVGVPAMASTDAPSPAGHIGTEVHVDTDLAISTASPLRTRDIATNLTIREYGDTVGAGAVNKALASSRACVEDEHCASLAVSFQIITMGGSHLHLLARNVSRATNSHCDGCQSAAGAYQFIVDTPDVFRMGAGTRRELARIQDALRLLEDSGASPATLHRRADQLAARVVAILQDAVAHVPQHRARTRPGYAPAPHKPSVTLHRLTDGWQPAGR